MTNLAPRSPEIFREEKNPDEPAARGDFRTWLPTRKHSKKPRRRQTRVVCWRQRVVSAKESESTIQFRTKYNKNHVDLANASLRRVNFRPSIGKTYGDPSHVGSNKAWTDSWINNVNSNQGHWEKIFSGKGQSTHLCQRMQLSLVHTNAHESAKRRTKKKKKKL